MRQQINLYQPALFEKKVPFSSRMSAGALGIVLFLVLVGGAADWWRLSVLKKNLTQLEKRQAAVLQNLEDHQRQNPPKIADPVLAREIEENMRERQSRLALLKLLNQDLPGNSRGFSSYLDGLGREDLETVWLRRIRLSDGGDELLLEGSTTHAADVPLYLQRLRQQQDYAGREFEHLQLSRSEKTPRLIDFLLQTTQEEKP